MDEFGSLEGLHSTRCERLQVEGMRGAVRQAGSPVGRPQTTSQRRESSSAGSSGRSRTSPTRPFSHHRPPSPSSRACSAGSRTWGAPDSLRWGGGGGEAKPSKIQAITIGSKGKGRGWGGVIGGLSEPAQTFAGDEARIRPPIPPPPPLPLPPGLRPPLSHIRCMGPVPGLRKCA